MSTINIFRGAFADKPEIIHEAENKAIKDIVKDDLGNAVIFVDGIRKDKNYVLKDGELCAIRVFPKPAVALAVGAIAFVVGAYMATDAIVRWATGKSILDHAKEALAKWLIGDVNSPSQPDSLQSIPQLRGAKNQSGLDKPFPFVMGKHLFTPYYVGKPYTSIGGEDGEDQYFHALFVLGYSRLKVTDIKIGEADLCSNSSGVYNGLLDPDGELFSENNPELELQQGAAEVSLYRQKVYEEQLSIELMNVKDKDNHVARFSAKNPQKMEVEFTFPQGLIKYNKEGKKQNATVSVVVEWRQGPDDPQEWRTFGTLSVTRQKAKVMRFVLEKTFGYNEIINVPGRVVELRIVRTTPEPTPEEKPRTSDTVYLSAIRTWCFDYDASTKPGVASLVPQVPMIAKDRDRTCRLGVKLKADDRLSGMINEINCIVQSCGRIWDYSDPDHPFWKPDEEPTQNPASIALKAMQSQMLGANRYADNDDGENDKIDLESFGAFYEWCDETVTETVAGKSVSRKRFSCNGVLTAEKRLDELLDAILTTGRGMRILRGGKYGVLIDQPRPNPVTILNNRNVLEANNQKNYEKLPDGYKIKFIDESDGYQANELYAMRDGADKDDPGMVIENIEMPFVTNRSQAHKNGRYQYACRKLRPETWNRKLSIDGNLLYIGCRVEVQDDTILVGIGEGAAITELIYDSDGNIEGIQTDGQFDVEATDTPQRYGVAITQHDGVHKPAVRTQEVPVTRTGLYTGFAFVEPILQAETIKPSDGDIVSFGIYDRVTTPALCFGKKDNGDGTFDVVLVPYQEGVYTADSGAMPEFDSKLTPPQALVSLPPLPPNTVTREEAIEIAQNFGAPPQNAIYMDLSNENKSIPCDVDGAPLAGALPFASEAHVYEGVDEITSGITWGLSSAPAGITIADGVVTVAADTVLPDVLDFDVMATYRGMTFIDTMTIAKVRAGSAGLDGQTAVIYSLLPSVDKIQRTAAGVTSPASVSCDKLKTVGNNPAVITTEKTLRYQLSNGSVADYAGEAVAIGSAVWIEFTLLDGPNVLDRERVPVVADGADGEDGGDGNGVASTVVAYQAGASGTTAPSGAWVSSPPAVAAGQYLWTKVVINYFIGDPSIVYSVAPPGKGIASSAVTYQMSLSGTTAPAGEWTAAIPTQIKGQYLWTRVIDTYTDATTSPAAYSVSYVATDGVGVSSAAVAYQASASGTAVPGSTWSASVPSVAAGQYLWTRTITSYSNGTSSTAYSVAYEGTNGTNGVGVSSSAVAYQASASGTAVPGSTWSASVPSVAAGQYLWTRTIITYSNGGTTTLYSVAYEGTNGTNGVGVSSYEVVYQAGASGTSAPAGTWSASVPAAIGGGLGEGGGLGAVLAEINDFVSVRTGTYAGSIYQYTDTNTWTRRELVAPGQIGKDYTELYMTALADIAAIPNIKNSSNSFAMLFANIISTLYLQIQNGGAIIGGDRYNNDGTDKSTASSAKGFWIGAGGDLKAANATLSQINITAGGTAAEFFDLLKKGSLLRVLAAGIRLYLPKSLTNLSDVNIVEGSVPAIIEPSDYPGTVTPGMWLRHHKGSTFYNTEIASIAGKSFGADSGYVKFGNGLLIQWGASYAPGASGANNMEFSFPLAFSDTNYIITTTYATPDLPTNTNNMYGNVRYSTKTTQKIVVKIYGENRIYWMAIGKG